MMKKSHLCIAIKNEDTVSFAVRLDAEVERMNTVKILRIVSSRIWWLIPSEHRPRRISGEIMLKLHN